MRALAAALALVALAAAAPPVRADELCRVIDVDLDPTPELQIVVWLEDAAGRYVDTLWITQSVGAYGLGNRPGVMGMRGGPNWPYGPRLDVFPVWSHRHGRSFQQVFFRNGDGDPGGPPGCLDDTCMNDNDRNLSHPFSHSTREIYYTRPLTPDEPAWDVGTASSPVYTDKGRVWVLTTNGRDECVGGDCPAGWECLPLVFDNRCQRPGTALYPPRVDVIYTPDLDDPSVVLYDDMNPFDEISAATPVGNAPFRFTAPIARDLPDGAYVLYVEVAKEFDYNTTYNDVTQPPISARAWNEYGLPYRGQPSVVFALPFELSAADDRVLTDVYAGYGDPLFADGTIRPPDATISTTTPGSGALRLGLAVDELTGMMYQVKMLRRTELDMTPPDAPGAPEVIRVDSSSADITFVEPGDDGVIGRVAGYEIRLRPSMPITEADFASAPPVPEAVEPEAAGELRTLELKDLLPRTHYFVGIRAYDDCRNLGPLQVIELETPDPVPDAVDACFIATAAYGSAMAADVGVLRRVRDRALRPHVLGELAVEAYYTFSPGLARLIGTSDLLRATTREALAPVVDAVR